MNVDSASNDRVIKKKSLFSVRFGVSLSSGSSPKSSVRNGKRGCGSAKEDEHEEGESQVSTQAATSTKYPIPQTPQSKYSSKLPHQTHSVILSCVLSCETCVSVISIQISDSTHLRFIS